MKYVIRMVVVFFLLILSSSSLFADDTDILGKVEIKVKPNVMIILDNSVSMRRIEGQVGPYDPTYQYEGDYKNDNFYYVWGLGIEDVNNPAWFGNERLSKITCETMKTELEGKGYWVGDAYKYPGNEFKCDKPIEKDYCASTYAEYGAYLAYNRNIYDGNYLNWYFFAIKEEKYNPSKTYFGQADSSKYYTDTPIPTLLPTDPLEARPKPMIMDIDMIAFTSLAERDFRTELKNKGKWEGTLYYKNGVYSDDCHNCGTGLFGVCKLLQCDATLSNYTFYSGDYLNWYFNRTTERYRFDAASPYEGDFSKDMVYFTNKTQPDRNYVEGVNQEIKEEDIMCDDLIDKRPEGDPNKTPGEIETEGFYRGTICAELKGFHYEYRCSVKVRSLEGYKFYSGNYLNWYTESRMNSAKRVLKQALGQRTDIRLGLMTFNDYVEPTARVFEDGGHINAEIQEDGNVNFLQELQKVSAITRPHSPIAETLAEAGRYFAGINGKCDNSTRAQPYTSPITNWCQPNHIIIISDGSSLADSDHNLYLTNYMCLWDKDARNNYIGDYDGDGKESGLIGAMTGNYLDDVAYYLNQNDIIEDKEYFKHKPHPPGKEEKQNIKIHTVGYRMDKLSDLFTTRRGNLLRTARNGEGEYVEVDDATELQNAITAMLANVQAGRTMVMTPVTPVDFHDKNYTGDNMYMAMFSPHMNQQGRWVGNMKKFRTDEYLTSANPVDLWSESSAKEIEEGGVLEILKAMKSSERVIYTNRENNKSLIPFSTTTFSDTSGGDNSWTTNDHTTLVSNISCGTSSGTCSEKLGEYALGDMIHFAPLVVDYKELKKSYVFVGANDGMLHCINDTVGDQKYGSETWAYIPYDQLGRLRRLTARLIESPTVNTHSYFIDGGRTFFETDDNKKLLIFGERRGGRNYHAVDITNPDSPTIPYIIDEIDESFGESWSNPRVVPVMYDKSTPKDVFWIGGGYDSDVQDKFDKNDQDVKPDKVGKGIYAIDASSGDMLVKANIQGIENCILDPVSFNPGYRTDLRTDDEIKKTPGLMNAHIDAHSRIYACDMAGNLWGVRQDEDKIISTDEMDTHMPGEKGGGWVAQKIFEPKNGKKVFHRPEVVLETFVKPKDNENPKAQRYYGEYVYFGTGDREHPNSINGNNGNGDDKIKPEDQNRFYAVKNYWDGTTAKEERDLKDVTDGQVGNSDLSKFSNKGWYIRLTGNGEKVVSYPVAYRGMVLFTTYTPPDEVKDHSPAIPATPHPGEEPATPAIPANETEDPCASLNSVGVARLYALNYKTGGPVLNLHRDINENGNEINGPNDLSLSDRSAVIGNGMPGSPNLIFPKSGGTKIMVGVGNKMFTQDLDVRDMTVFYWKEKH